MCFRGYCHRSTVSFKADFKQPEYLNKWQINNIETNDMFRAVLATDLRILKTVWCIFVSVQEILKTACATRRRANSGQWQQSTTPITARNQSTIRITLLTPSLDVKRTTQRHAMLKVFWVKLLDWQLQWPEVNDYSLHSYNRFQVNRTSPNSNKLTKIIYSFSKTRTFSLMLLLLSSSNVALSGSMLVQLRTEKRF